MSNKVKQIVSKVEKSLSLKIKVVIGAAVVGSLAGLSYLALQPDGNITSPTVMVTNITGSSGGSGVVISTTSKESIILTNSHVCGVVKNGGVISNNNGQSFLVTKYAQSKLHDLCMVHVQSDLKYSSKIAPKAPELYDEATVSGHPALLPNVLTKGHFSGKRIIQVMTGVRECTAEDLKNGLGLFCMIMGGVPVIQSYESMLVTAMIMPGSSGSAIYNKKGQVSGLVFAGMGELSYAFAVPYEYIVEFMHEDLEYKIPSYVLDIAELMKEEQRVKVTKEQLKRICQTPNLQPKAREVCDTAVRDIEWRM